MRYNVTDNVTENTDTLFDVDIAQLNVDMGDCLRLKVQSTYVASFATRWLNKEAFDHSIIVNDFHGSLELIAGHYAVLGYKLALTLNPHFSCAVQVQKFSGSTTYAKYLTQLLHDETLPFTTSEKYFALYRLYDLEMDKDRLCKDLVLDSQSVEQGIAIGRLISQQPSYITWIDLGILNYENFYALELKFGPDIHKRLLRLLELESINPLLFAACPADIASSPDLIMRQEQIKAAAVEKLDSLLNGSLSDLSPLFTQFYLPVDRAFPQTSHSLPTTVTTYQKPESQLTNDDYLYSDAIPDYEFSQLSAAD